MNILLIHQYFLEKEDGGGSRFNELTKIWTSLGNNVTVLSGMVHYSTGKKHEKYKGKYTSYYENFYPNVDVIRSHVSSSYNSNFLGRLWAYFSFVFSSIYAGLFKTKDKFDIILVTSPPLFVGITAYFLSKLKKTPFVFEVRDLWPESAIDTGILSSKLFIKFAFRFEKFIYRKAKLINVLTPAFREKLINEKQVPKEKIIFIPNAADFKIANTLTNFEYKKHKEKLGLNDKFVITYVGAHGVANHLMQLIEVADRIKDTNVIFQLIGDGMQKQMLKREVKQRGLNNIIFRDPVPKHEVFKYILASDLGTSVLKRVDTFKTIYSNKTFDYMSCKKPILLLIDGVSRELINNADCGWYAEPENIDDIENTIRNILKIKNIDQIGNNGYNYAKEYFDREILAKQYITQLRKCIRVN